MILHIIRSRVPDGAITLVTSVCNQAIGSVCDKLAKFHAVSPIVVLGNPRRVAASAAPFTVQLQVENHHEVMASDVWKLTPNLNPRSPLILLLLIWQV